jgi:anti-anti-sigma regulatory factor
LTIVEVADQLEKRGVVFAVAAASPHVRRQFDRYGLSAKIGNRYFDSAGAARDAFLGS